jgi:hypothetical protein
MAKQNGHLHQTPGFKNKTYDNFSHLKARPRISVNGQTSLALNLSKVVSPTSKYNGSNKIILRVKANCDRVAAALPANSHRTTDGTPNADNMFEKRRTSSFSNSKSV